MTGLLCKLGPKEVHCWTFQPAQFVVEELAAILSLDERERAGRFVFDRDRMEYVVCRGVLRHLLALYGGAVASELRFEYTPRGKPALTLNLHAPIQFNVAHSQGAGLIGVTRGAPIGVDIERMCSFASVAALVPACFALEEQAEFESLPRWVQPRAFYAGWTRKEAFIKATGEGLNRPLHSFAVTIAPDCCPKLLRYNDGPASAATWKIADLPSDPGFAAAVAVPDSEATIQARNLSPKFLGLRQT
jgi:4'-phosphopantetheinyl transferase